MNTSPNQRVIYLRILATGLLLLSTGLLLAALGLNSDNFRGPILVWLMDHPFLSWALIIVCLVSGVWIGFASLRPQETNAWIRLDWFLPMLKRRKAGEEISKSWFAAKLRANLPRRLQSDWQTKKRGFVRNVLRRLGPSWVASPIRRLTQATCLVIFCVLFFYCCWPYDAKPREIVELGTWKYDGFAQESGLFTFQKTKPLTIADADFEAGIATANRSLFVAEQKGNGESLSLGRFTVTSYSQKQLELLPEGELTTPLLNLIAGLGVPGAQFQIFLDDPDAWPEHYASNLEQKEAIPAETFLLIDPLVSLSTAVASRSWVWSLSCAGAILIVCVLIPRGFCGYLCPLGTTIDLFDWLFASRTERLRVPDDGWWVHIKYYLLGGILVAAVCGVLISGFFSAIPVITRGLLFFADPIQSGVVRGWHLVPNPTLGHAVSLLLFLGVLSLGFMRPRFWCKYVCPSGAVFSVSNLFRVTERKVESSCIHCNKCVEICPFDAIKPDFTTRTSDCTLCQSCGGVCPTHAIKFVERGNFVELKIEDDPQREKQPWADAVSCLWLRERRLLLSVV